MASPRSEILSREIKYTGEKMSVRSLEDSISSVRKTQNARVDELEKLQSRNQELQKILVKEIKKLRKFSDYLSKSNLQARNLWVTIKEILSYIPGLRRLGFTKRSIEELLRQQYEISAKRVKEAAEFADRLRVSESDLFNEIERLNQKVVESAKNEDLAAQYVLDLQEIDKEYQEALTKAGEGSVEHRTMQAEHDQLRRKLAEHSTMLQLYHTSEDRLARLKENTRKLAETIGNLASDITQYVNAASEKLDLASGQIQAIGTAADASVVMLEMKKSLDVMTDSMNQTTQFVSETQVFFRQNLDNLLNDLELYDQQTTKMLDHNLQLSKEIEERRIAEAVQVALERRSVSGATDGAPAS